MDDFKNKEGYPDPTPHEALKGIGRKRNMRRRFMPVVYICSPYRDDPKGNTERARRWSRLAVDMGCIPFTPHILFTQFMDDREDDERRTALFMGMVMLGKCSELWVFGDKVTDGMKREIEQAKEWGKRIRHFDGEGKEVSDV